MNPTTASIVTSEIPVVRRSVFRDVSLWFLLLANVVTIYFTVREGWDLYNVMLIYWFQSFSIGFFTVIRILLLKNYSVDGFLLESKVPSVNTTTKVKTAFFFVIHYGLFLLILFIMIPSVTLGGQSFSQINYTKYFDFTTVILEIIAATIFFLNHGFSYFYNRSTDDQKLNIGSLASYPYLRIVPMTLFLFLPPVYMFPSSFMAGYMIIFLILKTLIDALMHVIQHSAVPRN